MSNVSTDAIWQICRSHNAYLVKRKTSGGVQFSRDPLNLMNKHSRKYAGFINDQAIGLHPGEKGGVKMLKKLKGQSAKPASSTNEVTWGSNKTERKTYRAIVNQTAKQGYRADLRAEAVGRASAIRRSQRRKNDSRAYKLRGSKAKKAAENKSSS